MPVLEVQNLRKEFKRKTAVDGISFSLAKGEIIGFLGPNGAGKTTTIHMLLGITLPTSGSIRYFGEDFLPNREAVLSRMNTASAFNTLQGRLTVRENLYVFADLYGVKNAKEKINELLERFELQESADDLYWSLSSGQRTRANLSKSLLNDPEILLMDEPTASLDPDIADKTLSMIEELRRDTQLSILYTSHNMAEITRICDRVIFLDNGVIVAEDTPKNLTKRVTHATLRLVFSEGVDAIKDFLSSRTEQSTWIAKNIVEIYSDETQIPELLFGASKVGGWITDIEIKKPTLEDVFLQIARRDV